MRVHAHENNKVYAHDGVVCTWDLSIKQYSHVTFRYVRTLMASCFTTAP